MESFIASYLKDTFDLWLKNFDPKRDLSVRTIKGEATINRLQVNDEVVRELFGFESLDVTRLNVASCLLNVSPTKLSTAPTLVELGDVDIVLSELETPRPLPQVYAELVAKRERDIKPTKPEEYGLRDKIADGVRLSVSHIQLVVNARPLRGPFDTTDWHAPLLVVSIRNFVLQQTDPNWNVVDLKSARKHNRSPDFMHVFRQATCSVSVHLVPFRNDPNEPAAALLHGAKLEGFISRHDASGQHGAALGATTIIKDVPITMRLIQLRRTRDNASLDVQLDVLIPKINLKLTPRDLALVQDFLQAWDRIKRRANLIADAAAAASKARAAMQAQNTHGPSPQLPPQPLPPRIQSTSGARPVRPAGKSPATAARGTKPVQPTTLRPPTLTSRLMVFFGADEPGKPKPGVVCRLKIGKVIMDLHGLQPSPDIPKEKVSQRRHPLVKRMAARIERIYVTMQQQILPAPRNDELAVQIDVGWFQWLSYNADPNAHPKPIAFPSAEHEAISGFLSIARDIHPFIATEDDYERSILFRCSYIDRLPCPPPPAYGKEMQLRLRRLEAFLREEDFDFLCAFALVMDRLKYKPAPPPSGNTTRSSSSTSSRRASNASSVGVPLPAALLSELKPVAAEDDITMAPAQSAQSPTTMQQQQQQPPQLPPRRNTSSLSNPSFSAVTPSPRSSVNALPTMSSAPSLPPRPGPAKSTTETADKRLVKDLMGMGFELQTCERALAEIKSDAPNRMELAISWILDHDGETHEMGPPPPVPQSQPQISPTAATDITTKTFQLDTADEPTPAKLVPAWHDPLSEFPSVETAASPAPSSSRVADVAVAAAPTSSPAVLPETQVIQSPSPAPAPTSDEPVPRNKSPESVSSISTSDSKSITATRLAPPPEPATDAPETSAQDQEEAEYALLLLQAANIPYNTYSCMIDVNGPTVHVFPRAFNVPVFTIRLSKIVCAGHGDLPPPVYALHTAGAPSSKDPFLTKEKEYFSKAPRPVAFPDTNADFVSDRIRMGLGKQSTKLEIFILPFSMLLLGGFKDEATDDDISVGGYNPMEDISKPSPATSSHATPIAKLGETQIGINWDDTASPQLMVSIMTNNIEVPLAQDMLHFLYMMSEEYIKFGLPDFYYSLMQMDGDFQWTDLLKYLPNPSGEPLPTRISGYTIVPLLPTYAVGLLWKNVTLSLHQNGNEITKATIVDTSLVLEHQIRTAHMVVGKFFIRDISMWSQPRGVVMERRPNEGLLIAARIEEEIREAMKPSERRMKLLQQQQQAVRTTELIHPTVAKTVDKLQDLEAVAQAALNAEHANRLSSTFATLRDLVENRKIFRKNGFQLHLGVLDLILNYELFVSLAAFFTADPTPATRTRMEALRIANEASAHAMQQLMMINQRGRYYNKQEIEHDMNTGFYGIPPLTGDSAAARATSSNSKTAAPQPRSSSESAAAAPKDSSTAVAAAPSPPKQTSAYVLPDKALPGGQTLSSYQDALVSLDRLSATLAILEDAVFEMDRQPLIMGQLQASSSAAAAKSSESPKLSVPTSSVPNEFKRRGNEKLSSYWQTIHRTIIEAKREQDKLKRLVALEWPGEAAAATAVDAADRFDDADVPLPEELPPIAVLDLSPSVAMPMIATIAAPGPPSKDEGR